MKLHYSTLYAIWSIVELAARQNEVVSASDLAAKYGMSQHHLAKVLRTLSNAGIVSSTRGPGGGCTFTGNAKRLTMHDIISIFEPTEDLLPKEERQDAPPLAREVDRVLGEIDRIAAATLKSVTIMTLIQNGQRNGSVPPNPGTQSGEASDILSPRWIIDK
ncbi:RrF2 family transcriptional regulator [Ochrobactrum teleogrylli]|uniref:RrF2 family transcriptional regulator n=1 Tax=Ochrobactrum teleogrylli TaxID=2479765 RepID=UPI00384E6B22